MQKMLPSMFEFISKSLLSNSYASNPLILELLFSEIYTSNPICAIV